MTRLSVPQGARRPLRYLVAVLALAALLIVGKLALAYALLGTPTLRAERACASVEARVVEAAGIADPKLVLVGGSGVRRGINAERLAAALEVPVVNFGLQAGLGPQIILEQAKRVLRPGDAALLTLEYNHYEYARATSVSVELTWGCFVDYFWSRGAGDKLALLSNFGPDLMLDTLAPHAVTEPADPEGSLQCRGGVPSSGDLRLDEATFPPLAPAERERLSLYRPIHIVLDESAEGARAIADFAAWARANDVALFATWPNTIVFDSYSTDPAFDRIRRFYFGLDVPVVGRPEIALLPLELFYDTQYHLNRAGIVKRTEDLLPHLEAALASWRETVLASGVARCPAAVTPSAYDGGGSGPA